MNNSKYPAPMASLAALAATLVFEMLPSGAVLVFSDGAGKRIRETYSYFDRVPFGYANFFPFITALLTVIVTILTILSIMKKESTWLRSTTWFLSIVALVCSVLPFLMFGIVYMSLFGVIITTLLLVSVLLQALARRNVTENS